METAELASPELRTKIAEWLSWDQNETTRVEVEDLVAKEDFATLEEIMMHRLEFGTAGLRGVMAAGYSRMNDLVIIQTSQGLASYVQSSCPDAKNQGVVIGFDGRHNSERFAHLAAAAFIGLHIPVHLFSKMVPTPFIPYGVVKFGAAAGLMVTASHNPKDDNGYKVYWTNGAQIITPHDQGIRESILNNLKPWPDAWKWEAVAGHPLRRDSLAEVGRTYFDMLKADVIYADLNASTPLRFTFTPMHGVSCSYMFVAFEACSLAPFIPVKEQMEPDPDFPTVKFPNPEEGKSALDLSMKTANENGSTVILANDPDADRLAIAEKQSTGEWKVFTGNEIGGLLGWWMWHCYRKRNPDAPAEEIYMIASTVSSKILKSIANIEGFNFIETLTGFKWMANKAHELILQGRTVLLAFEEAIGFMCGTTVLDKDGINAAVKAAEMAAYLNSNGLTLSQKVKKIYERYGYHVSRNSYFICYDQPTITAMFERIRNYDGPNTYPKACGPFAISGVRDLTTGYDSSSEDEKATLPVSKESQMITFTFENGCVATLRTSGTEPKIKYYTELCAKPSQTDWAALDAELEKLVEHMVNDLMQPKRNNLVPRID